MPTTVSALIVTWNSEATIGRCVAALQAAETPLEEILVLDNASSDGTWTAVADLLPAGAIVQNDANQGFAIGMNALAGRAKGDALLLVNPDAYVRPDAVDVLLQTLSARPGSVIGGAIEGLGGGLQTAAGRPHTPWWRVVRWLLGGPPHRWALPEETSTVDAVSGAFMLVPSKLWKALGGFDEGFRHSGEDVDLCWRARRLGADVVFEPRAVAKHELEASVRQAPAEIEVLRWDGVVRLAAHREGPFSALAIRAALASRTGTGLFIDRFRRVSRDSCDRRRAALLFRWAVRPARAPLELPEAPVRR